MVNKKLRNIINTWSIVTDDQVLVESTLLVDGDSAADGSSLAPSDLSEVTSVRRKAEKLKEFPFVAELWKPPTKSPFNSLKIWTNLPLYPSFNPCTSMIVSTTNSCVRYLLLFSHLSK